MITTPCIYYKFQYFEEPRKPQKPRKPRDPSFENNPFRYLLVVSNRKRTKEVMSEWAFSLKGPLEYSQICRISRISKKWTDYSASLGRRVTREYLNQRGTKIRVFRACFRASFLPPLFPYSFILFPLQALSPLLPLFPSSPPPFIPPLLTPRRL